MSEKPENNPEADDFYALIFPESRRPSRENDPEIWQNFTRSVTPLPDFLRFSPEKKRQNLPKPRFLFSDLFLPAPAFSAAEFSFLHPETPSSDTDPARRQAFMKGQIRPEKKLDLHGKTVQAAYPEFIAFLAEALEENRQCIEIVTGLGGPEKKGLIRQEFIGWLNTPVLRPFILAVTYPHKKNTGAFFLLLRRKKT